MSSSNKEVDECGTGARWSPNCEITEEELCFVRRLVNRRSFQTTKRLDDWLRIMEEVVKVLGILYRSSFRLFESNNFKDESILDLLRTVYISAMESCASMSPARIIFPLSQLRGESAFGFSSKLTIARHRDSRVQAGVQWSLFKMSRQIAPLSLLMFGCQHFVMNFICDGCGSAGQRRRRTLEGRRWNTERPNRQTFGGTNG
jgi:hypothetical protein